MRRLTEKHYAGIADLFEEGTELHLTDVRNRVARLMDQVSDRRFRGRNTFCFRELGALGPACFTDERDETNPAHVLGARRLVAQFGHAE